MRHLKTLKFCQELLLSGTSGGRKAAPMLDGRAGTGRLRAHGACDGVAGQGASAWPRG
jgi:hypothetical protein